MASLAAQYLFIKKSLNFIKKLAMKKLIIILLVTLSSAAFAQKDPLEKVWYNQEKTSKIEIYKAVDGNFYGKIIWLQTPNDKAGKPRTDIENKDEKLRSTPLQGMLILRKFKKGTEANVYESGTVYDPNNGKTYCGKLTLNGTELKLRGFICGWTWLGRTSTWTLAQ
jgi:uncharacterized protein (DUF2147 family)